MNTVIKVDFKQPVQLTGNEKVSLRDVWVELGKPKEFGNWVKQIALRFSANSDFGLFDLEVKKQTRGRPEVNYWVTVDAAKKIAMSTLNEAGDKVRAYFLECEKLVYANNLEPQLTNVPTLVTPDFMRRIADELEFQTKRAENAEASALTSAKLVAVAENTTTSLIANAVDTALKYSIDSQAVAKQYPLILKMAMKWRATQPNRDNPRIGVNGWVTIYLRVVHEVKNHILKEKGDYAAQIYNRDDIEKINQELTNAK